MIIILIVGKFNKKTENKTQIIEENKYQYSCVYNSNDGYKKTIEKYLIDIDEYSRIKNIKFTTSLDYDKNNLYLEAKNYFENQQNLNITYYDSEMVLEINNYIDENEFKNKNYSNYIGELDKRFLCEKLQLNTITYECSNKQIVEGYEYIKDIHTIASDNNMNVSKIIKKTYEKYSDMDLYHKNKAYYLDMYDNYVKLEDKKDYDFNFLDKDKSIVNTYVITTKDENGEAINIKDYIDTYPVEYNCIIKG